MALQKFTPKAGVDKENTRLFNEGRWWDSDRVRFRQGTPEQIGGWQQVSSYRYVGVCRALWTWATLGGVPITAVGTNLKYYIENGGQYCDITPARAYQAVASAFTATPGSSVVSVNAPSHGGATGDYARFRGALSLSTQTFTVTIASPAVVTLTSTMAENTPVVLSTTGALPTGLTAGLTYYLVNVSGTTANLANVAFGAPIDTSGSQSGTHSISALTGVTDTVLNAAQGYQITVIDGNTFTIDVSTAATVYDTGDGGTGTNVVFCIASGEAISLGISGWGGGAWGAGSWGNSGTSTSALRLWNQSNFGQDLVFGYRGGAMYYWNANLGTTPQAVTMTIASPAVFTYSQPLLANTAVVLESDGALPTGLSIGTVHYVRNPVGTTFQLSATPGGAAINTSGSQSGVHYLSVRGLPLTSLAGASDVPVAQNMLLVSDTSRFLLAFGTNPIGQSSIDPMFIRWSDQESTVNWTPSATNQAGGQRLSHGSRIVTAMQTRQEILVWTDASLYSMQYLGPPYVWGIQLLGDNISVASPNCAGLASGVVYWMGIDKFYRYDGRVQTLRCDLRRHVFSDINLQQADQIICGTNEGFNEVWWFYCSAGSTVVNRYVMYNYVEDCWANGTLGRTAWNDAGLYEYPVAATYENTLVFHEVGCDDNTTGTPQPINSYILSSEFDIGDGNSFGFVWRMLPDVSFAGSSAASPTVTLTLNTLKNSGSGYTSPASVGGTNTANVVETVSYPIEQYTGQVNTRVRGRQLSFKISCDTTGTTWQLGATRIDVRPDGRR